VVRHEGGGPAVIIGHAFWQLGRAHDASSHPGLCAVSIVAAAAAYPAGFRRGEGLSEAG
jgi:hypothetical protein